MLRSVAAAGLATLLLGACVSETLPPLAPYDLPISAQTRLRRSRDSGVASAASTTVAYVASIDLPSALAVIGARSVEVRYAEAKVEEARQGIYAAYGSLLPTAYAGVVAHAHRDALQQTTGEFVDVTKQQEFGGGGVQVQWDAGSAIFNGLAAARRADAAEAETATARADAALAVAEGYFGLVRARALGVIAQRALEDALELQRVEEKKEKDGAAVIADVRRAEALVAQDELLRTQADAEVAVVSARLAALLELTPNIELSPVDTSPMQLYLVSLDKPISELLDRAELARPELHEAEFLVDAAEHDLERVKWGPLVPEVEAGAQRGFLGHTFGQADDSNDYVAGLGWKIGPGGIFDLPAINSAAARVRQKTLRVEGLKVEIARQVVEARARALAADQEVVSAKKGVAAAREALRLSNEKFLKGVGVLLEVLDAQSALTQAQTSEVEAIVHFDQLQYRLLHAIGEPLQATRPPQ
jgi:outer membrane protein TolC